jgi:uncharacterized protein YjbI with pentapeptide repeats
MRAIGEALRWFLRSGLRRAILALFIVAFLWFLLWFLPQRQGENLPQKVPAEERAALVNEYRRTWAQIIGGFALLLGLYFTWRRIAISQQELEATRDQQVTERFTRAIDQLGATDDKGNKKLEIRLGGIYALERIAGDSLAMENSPGRDYSTVMEVLTAYVRENTAQAPELHPLRRWLRSTAKPPAPPEPTADIQAILDVLGRTQGRIPEECRIHLDLREANLQRADLIEANLQGADLIEANLQYANLVDANLQEADLQGANLQGVNLLTANLQGANLLTANLQGADLREADLQGAFLQGAYLQGAFLQGANLQGADLLTANLQGAYLQGDLQGAFLQGAFLQGADLQYANLQEAEVTDEQLADTRSLQGATMPNGQKYEDWLKVKEGSGKDVQNE